MSFSDLKLLSPQLILKDDTVMVHHDGHLDQWAPQIWTLLSWD